MDLLIQTLGSFFGMLFLVAIAVWVCTPLLWTWLLFRAFRDVHSISESLHWIAHCTRSTEEAKQARAMRVANSQFGR